MLAKAKKSFKYTVEVLCSRLRHLNKLMSKLPGANDTLPYDEGAFKIELFKMMLSDWQINFNNAGLDIMDDAYMLQRLLGAFHDSSRGDVQRRPGTQAERNYYVTSSLQSSPSGWRICDIPTRSSRRLGFAGAYSGVQSRRRCRGQPIAPSIQAYTTGRCVSPIHMGRTIGQVSVQACQGEQPGEDVETAWAARDSHVTIKMSNLQRIL
jgi:hypothetical protein